MRIGDLTIPTPFEDNIGYPLDWRSRIAASIVEEVPENRRPPTLHGYDTEVCSLVRHLLRRRKSPLKPGAKPTRHDTVLGWHESDAGPLIEAFLAASSSCETAAAELGLDPCDMRIYACLFYDLHTGEGKVRPAVMMRLRAEADNPDEPAATARLRRVALTGGIHGLRSLLSPTIQNLDASAEPTLDELVEQELRRRLVTGELRTCDLVRLQANALMRERIARENSGEGNHAMQESVMLVQKILGLTMPRMVKSQLTPDQTGATNEAIRARFAAQQNITTTQLQDDGPEKGEEALNRMIGESFKGAIPE